MPSTTFPDRDPNPPDEGTDIRVTCPFCGEAAFVGDVNDRHLAVACEACGTPGAVREGGAEGYSFVLADDD